MYISYYCLCLIIIFINPLDEKLSVATGVDVFGCPIYIRIVLKYSPVWQFINCAPISVSIDDASVGECRQMQVKLEIRT